MRCASFTLIVTSLMFLGCRNAEIRDDRQNVVRKWAVKESIDNLTNPKYPGKEEKAGPIPDEFFTRKGIDPNSKEALSTQRNAQMRQDMIRNNVRLQARTPPPPKPRPALEEKSGDDSWRKNARSSTLF